MTATMNSNMTPTGATVVYKDKPVYRYEFGISENAKGFPQLSLTLRGDDALIQSLIDEGAAAYADAKKKVRPEEASSS